MDLDKVANNIVVKQKRYLLLLLRGIIIENVVDSMGRQSSRAQHAHCGEKDIYLLQRMMCI